MSFHNREDAALKIAKELDHLKGVHALVLAVPRGGVPMGKIVADKIDGELDVVLVRKLRHPNSPEYAIGAIDENGEMYINESEHQDVDRNYWKSEAARQLEILKQRRNSYTPIRPRTSPKGRVVVIVDDGIATGYTLLAAASLIKNEKPKKLIIACGVGSDSALELLKNVCDEIICLVRPTIFHSVSNFYDDFSEVSDDDVVSLLSSDHS